MLFYFFIIIVVRCDIEHKELSKPNVTFLAGFLVSVIEAPLASIRQDR